MVTVRWELPWLANDKRKNRMSHRWQRNGLRKRLARIPFSRSPLRLDKWIRLLPHSGHRMMVILRLQNWHTKLPQYPLLQVRYSLSRFVHPGRGRWDPVHGGLLYLSFRALIRPLLFLLHLNPLYLPKKQRARLKLMERTQ